MDVKIIEATRANGKAIYTFQLKYPRFFHSELLTHRMLSRNASSSRAIPVSKVLKQVWKDPAMPLHWGLNQPGMQADKEAVGWKKWLARKLWVGAGKAVCVYAWVMLKMGLAKQVVNRLLEPWQYIHVVVTATEFDNFFALRDHKDAQPEFQFLAKVMRSQMYFNKPRDVEKSEIPHNDWHLPYVTYEERKTYSLQDCLKFSAARCARVSYLTHDKKNPTPDQDRKLYDRLVGSEPRHSSPVEHQAIASNILDLRSNNFIGWIQHRELLEKAESIING